MKESEIQRQVIMYCRSKHKLDFFVFSIPNEALMKVRAFVNKQKMFMIFNILKSTGFVSGLPDLVFIKSGKILFIEMKNKTGKLTDSQKKMFPRLEKFLDYKIPIARSLDDVLDILASYNYI